MPGDPQNPVPIRAVSGHSSATQGAHTSWSAHVISCPSKPLHFSFLFFKKKQNQANTELSLAEGSRRQSPRVLSSRSGSFRVRDSQPHCRRACAPAAASTGLVVNTSGATRRNGCRRRVHTHHKRGGTAVPRVCGAPARGDTSHARGTCVCTHRSHTCVLSRLLPGIFLYPHRGGDPPEGGTEAACAQRFLTVS